MVEKKSVTNGCSSCVRPQATNQMSGSEFATLPSHHFTKGQYRALDFPADSHLRTLQAP